MSGTENGPSRAEGEGALAAVQAPAALEQFEQRFAGGDGAGEAVLAKTLVARYSKCVKDGGPEVLDAHRAVLDIGTGLIGFAVNGAAENPAAGKPSKPDTLPSTGRITPVEATDAPLLPHQLKRMAKRAALGLARTGGTAGNGSGDLFLAFSTANPGTAAPSGVA